MPRVQPGCRPHSVCALHNVCPAAAGHMQIHKSGDDARSPGRHSTRFNRNNVGIKNNAPGHPAIRGQYPANALIFTHRFCHTIVSSGARPCASIRAP